VTSNRLKEVLARKPTVKKLRHNFVINPSFLPMRWSTLILHESRWEGDLFFERVLGDLLVTCW
jgi:hypothetical protein